MPKSPTAPSLSVLILCLAAAALGGGCAASIDPSRASPPFPQELAQARTLDIQVFREGNTIWLTNTTATPIGPGRLWLNAWFSHPLETLGVGETLELKLSSFYDQHGEPFRGGGGFFAARDPEAIVLAQVHQAAALPPAAPPSSPPLTPIPPAPPTAGASNPPATELLGLIVVGGGPTG